MNHAAANHVEIGVCERWKIVPAVAEFFLPQSAHIHEPDFIRQPFAAWYLGQAKPAGQRNRSRYVMQDESSGNHSRKSWNVRG